MRPTTVLLVEASELVVQPPLELRVERADGGYALTGEGERLLEAYRPLDAWARRWARRAGAG